MICDQVEVRQCQKQLENSSAEDSSQRLRGDPSSPESKEESAASHESLIDSTSSSPPGKRQPVASRSSEEASPTCAYVPKTRCEPTERCRNMTSEIASCKKVWKFNSYNQCGQIGRFLKVLGDRISSKKAQMIGNFLGYFEIPHSYVIATLATFWATFGENGHFFHHLVTLVTTEVETHILGYVGLDYNVSEQGRKL